MSPTVHAEPATGAQPSRRERPSTAARVLVVDADPAVLLTLKRALQQENYLVVTAFDADGALMAARRLGPFELMITPLRMAPVNGVELARALRAFEPALQVLYVTNGTDELLTGSLPQTVDDEVIESPFTTEELLDAVAVLLYWHRRPRSAR
jgi:DNA-binding response OmpR family regulator